MSTDHAFGPAVALAARPRGDFGVPAWARPASSREIWREIEVVLPRPVDDPVEPLVEPDPTPGPLAFSEEEVARLCAAAAIEAAAAATSRAQASLAAEAAAATSHLAASLTSLGAILTGRRAEMEAGALAIGAGLGRYVAREALAGDPAAAARATLAAILPELREEAEVEVRVAPGTEGVLREALAGIAAGAGCAAAVFLRPDPGLLPGEVGLRWRDGWADRLLNDLESRAAALLGLPLHRALGGPDPVDSLEVGE